MAIRRLWWDELHPGAATVRGALLGGARLGVREPNMNIRSWVGKSSATFL
jgi:hypothetical protein